MTLEVDPLLHISLAQPLYCQSETFEIFFTMLETKQEYLGSFFIPILYRIERNVRSASLKINDMYPAF